MFQSLKENTLFRVLSLNSLVVGVSFILGLISTKVVAIYLGTMGMTLLGSFRNFSALLKSMATLGLNTSLIKLIAENKTNKEKLAGIYASFFWVFIILASVLALMTVSFSSFISTYIFFDSKYFFPISLFGLILPLVVLNVFWQAIYNGWEEYKTIIYIQIISNVLIFTCTVFLIIYEQISGALLSIALAEIIAFLVTLFFIRKNPFFFNIQSFRNIQKTHFTAIQKFVVMALISAVVVPLTLIAIRNHIVTEISVNEAGIWDAINRLSGFYMVFFTSGLSMYYYPKLASIHTDKGFKKELGLYFKTFVPLFLVAIISIYFLRNWIVALCFSNEFSSLKSILIWQLLGDFLKVLTLAFAYQILIKTMVAKYIIIELVFNLSYFFLAIYLLPIFGLEGIVKAYFFANLFVLCITVSFFKKVLFQKQH